MTRHFREDPLPVTLAARLLPDLGGDQRHHADDLRLRGKPVGIEAIGRPRKVVVYAVEAEAKEMLKLFRCAPPIPAGWLVGSGDGGQARYCNDVAVLVNSTGLSQLAHWGTSHARISGWRSAIEQVRLRARVCEEGGSAQMTRGLNFRTPSRGARVFPE